MFNILNLLKRLKIITLNIIHFIIINTHNPYTIENYYRKKGYSIGTNNRIYTFY